MDLITERIQENLNIIKQKIDQAAKSVGRNENEIKLIAVSKAQPFNVIFAAYHLGIVVFGENYPEETLGKIYSAAEIGMDVEWHMIGHLQSRKAKIICENFDYMHSLDSLKIAHKLELCLQEDDKILPVLLEFNVGGEENKYGWWAFDERKWEDFASDIEQLITYRHLEIQGIMTMPPLMTDPEEVRPYFVKLHKLQDFLMKRFPQANWNELSMGTSLDYEVAIQEGSTFVRIGSALFGPRPYIEKMKE
ncbi:MAG: YggS family pyridoxal phosphate-dependent enzyme [Anaerolineaceae bacterium]